MISVCMATYNGARYIKEQISSILAQLGECDEIIISDDHSTDETIRMIKDFNDARIKVFFNSMRNGVTHNFENALLHSKGDIIFLADQDDVWLSGKIRELSTFLLDNNYDVVIGDCTLTDESLNVMTQSYYNRKSPLSKSVWGNLLKNLWLGSCMAFTRQAMKEALPFPPNAVAHDLWLGLYFQKHMRCAFYPKVLQLYRRHDNTVSSVGRRSSNPITFRIKYRLYILLYLLLR